VAVEGSRLSGIRMHGVVFVCIEVVTCKPLLHRRVAYSQHGPCDNDNNNASPQGERSLTIRQRAFESSLVSGMLIRNGSWRLQGNSSDGCACAILFDTEEIELVFMGTSPVFPEALVEQSHRTWRCFFWVSRWSNHYTGAERLTRGLGGDLPCLLW
jgi:hypothetical protein